METPEGSQKTTAGRRPGYQADCNPVRAWRGRRFTPGLPYAKILVSFGELSSLWMLVPGVFDPGLSSRTPPGTVEKWVVCFVFQCMSSRGRSLQLGFGCSVEDLVREDHPYRRLLRIVPFDGLCAPLRSKYSKIGRVGFPVESMFKILVLQWMEDLSDREAERFLQENVAGKLFCGFSLTDATPDYSSICVARGRIGVEGLAVLFAQVRQSLLDAGLAREVFTFVDATHLMSKANLWKERDKSIVEGIGRLSNANIAKVASDSQARFGKKGRTKWYGYKFHVSVDMTQGLIMRIAATPANVEDMAGARHVLPRQGTVFADKAYGVGSARRSIAHRGLHSGAVLKNGMRAKNHDKDRWLTSVRMPYEGTFARFEKRARYRGTKKCQMQGFFQAMAHNFKRLIKIDAPPLELGRSCA